MRVTQWRTIAHLVATEGRFSQFSFRERLSLSLLQGVPNQPHFEGPLVFPVPKAVNPRSIGPTKPLSQCRLRPCLSQDEAGAKQQREEFTWHDTKEPHLTRRKMILAAHPEMKELYGPDPLMVYKVALVLLVQLVAMLWVRTQSWAVFFLLAYTVGGTANHALSLASHELSHNLAFRKPQYNTILGIFANFGMGFPASATFKRYHMEHHADQGVDGVDVDVPTEWEGRVFRGKLLKTLWFILQPAFYALRPMVIRPKPPIQAEVVNFVCVAASDLFIYHYFGPAALGYLIASTLLGLGLHPTAGHFVAEHYEFVTGQETYSYYGPLNWVRLLPPARRAGHRAILPGFPSEMWNAPPPVVRLLGMWGTTTSTTISRGLLAVTCPR